MIESVCQQQNMTKMIRMVKEQLMETQEKINKTFDDAKNKARKAINENT